MQPGIAEFIEAVKSGDQGRVRSMLARRPELVRLDTSEGDERRGLHWAVMGGDAGMVRLLMEAGADPHQGVWPHRDATSPLVLARERGHGQLVAIIEAEEQHRRQEMSCPNVRVSPVQERIHEAIHEGDREGAIALLSADLTLIQACDATGGSPLHAAAEAGDAELVSWLLARRAHPNKEDAAGRTPLDRAVLAVCDDFEEVARLLLDAGAALTTRAAVALGDRNAVRVRISADRSQLYEIDWIEGGLLTVAVRHNRLHMARFLLDLGADVDARTLVRGVDHPVASWGSPLWWASRSGTREMVALLLEHGADPNANVYASGWPLQNAWTREDQSIKRLLLERGAVLQPYMLSEQHDVPGARERLTRDASAETISELLWSAADSGCAEIVELALARVDWPHDDPRWHWVLIQPMRGIHGDEREGFFDCLRLLLERADPNVARFGQTALHFTAGHRGKIRPDERARFAAILADAGARMDLRDEMLQATPLGWARRWDRQEMARELERRGAPI